MRTWRRLGGICQNRIKIVTTATIYVPCHNYGNYLEKALDSIIAQTFDDWELIIIDEGSKDNTAEIANKYKATHGDKIRFIHHDKPRGLLATANEAIELARGRYIMRLDADDWLDDNALLVMTNYLDKNSDTGLVYPNYIYVDAAGNHIGIENRKQIGTESRLLDLPAHGACTMVRRRILKNVGGYDETLDRQDGYQLWLKISSRFKVANISTPLFFYRQHGKSLSQDDEQLLATRAKIKQAQVKRQSGSVRPRIICVVGAKNSYVNMPKIVLTEIAGQPLINYTLDAVTKAACFDTVIVNTDDQSVVDYCNRVYPNIVGRVRPERFSTQQTDEVSVVKECLSYLENEQDMYPDVVVLLSLHSPLRNSEHIRTALDTLFLYDIDSVISISENRDLHYVHARDGLEPLNPSMHRQIRTEREGLYTYNGAIRVMWADTVNENDILGRRVGHITMPYWESIQIKSQRDAWLIEEILNAQTEGRNLVPKAWLSVK